MKKITTIFVMVVAMLSASISFAQTGEKPTFNGYLQMQPGFGYFKAAALLSKESIVVSTECGSVQLRLRESDVSVLESAIGNAFRVAYYPVGNIYMIAQIEIISEEMYQSKIANPRNALPPINIHNSRDIAVVVNQEGCPVYQESVRYVQPVE